MLTLVFLLLISTVTADVLFRQYPFIMTHDAGTGEALEIRDGIWSKWKQTQSVGLVAQLNCGARAFDYRPYSISGKVFVAHDKFIILKPMEESISDVHNWANANPTELVIFYLSHFAGDATVVSDVDSLLLKSNVYTISDCSLLNTITYESVFAKSVLPGGGHIVFIKDCVDETFDDTVNCFGKNGIKFYNCEIPSKSKFAFDTLTSYANGVTSVPHSGMFMTQTHWQWTGPSVALGVLQGSSLIRATEKSNINDWTTDKIKSKAWTYLNIVEVDEVCDGGLQMLDTLRNVYLPTVPAVALRH